MTASSPGRVETLKLPPDLFDYQIDLISDPADELATVSCPQVGKTEGCAAWLVMQAWKHPGTMCWWVGPTYRQVEDGYHAAKRILQAGGVPARFVDHKKVIYLRQGSIIEFRSFDVPGNLSGRPVHFMVVDEAHELTQEVITILDARRSATLGPVRYNGNATGENSVWCDLWEGLNRRGLTRRWTWRDRYQGLLDQGFANEAERYKARIDEYRARMPESEFKRVYEAEWAVSEETIFGPYVTQVFTAPWSDVPHPGHRYVIPCDIGLVDDYTVATAICRDCLTATWSWRERGNTTVEPAEWAIATASWEPTKNPRLVGTKLEHRLARVAEHWNNGHIVIERNGPGQPVLDDVTAIWNSCSGWWTDDVSKREAVLQWVALAKVGRLTMPADPDTIREHRRFKSVRQRSGAWTFGAPSGEKDDRVMSSLIGIGHLTTGGAAFVEMVKDEVARMQRAKEAAKEQRAH